jgi:putative flippase GtrA
MYYLVSWSADPQWHYAVAFTVASEVSILENFFPNDAITFRRLPGHSRPWLVRCARFHLNYLLGTLLQLIISFSLHLLGSSALFVQAAAIGIVTAFNFAFHHIFQSVAHGGTIPRAIQQRSMVSLPTTPVGTSRSSATVTMASGRIRTIPPSGVGNARISSVRPMTRITGNGLSHAQGSGLIITRSPIL